jgi:hypothetical protein
LPMYQFAYFVGKMTHRPDARRQNEPASLDCIDTSELPLQVAVANREKN